MKLHKGIGETPLSSAGDVIRTTASDAGGVITVTIVTDAQALAEDKKAMVAALHGWDGKRHTAEPDDDGTYEAMVYSNVADPTPGEKFSEEYSTAIVCRG